jgi:ligand-binding SRPBCC domain-containing protein
MRDFTREPILANATVLAPIERVFALSTRVELVKETLGMNLVASPGTVAAGHITAHSRVHWRGWKFGLPTEHHTLITGFSEPHPAHTPEQQTPLEGELVAWFQDSQEQGRFAFFQHDHYFRAAIDESTGNPVTLLHDEVRFRLPFGPLGAIAASLLLAPHIVALCRQRFDRIADLAEGEGWHQWLDVPAEA